MIRNDRIKKLGDLKFYFLKELVEDPQDGTVFDCDVLNAIEALESQYNKITEFEGNYRFLSNFYPADILYEGRIYPSSEHLYQALKTHDDAQQKEIYLAENPSQAKKLGKKVTLRPDWDEVKDEIMEMVVRFKFVQNSFLIKWLLKTGNATLEERNPWGDVYWGISSQTGVGENKLGKILEKIRDELAE